MIINKRHTSIILKIILFAPFVFAKSNDLDAYSEEELTKLAQLRDRVKDGFTTDFMYENKFLIRFLRAKGLNLQGAEDLIRGHFRWRKEHEADIMNEAKLKELRKWTKSLPYSISTLDKDGRPSLVTGLNDLDLRRLVLAGETEGFRRYTIHAVDNCIINLHRLSNQTQKEMTNINILLNLFAYERRRHGCLACIPLWAETAINYESQFPLLGHKIIAVNTPRLFQNIYKLVLPLLREETRNVIRVYGLDKNEFSSELLKTFPKNQLPREFGGDAIFEPHRI